jgi:hypothetical protein
VENAKEVLVVRQVFTNKDGSTAILHLASSDLTRGYDDLTTTCKKTVASGGISQIFEVQRQPGQVADANAANPKQPWLSVDLRRLQARMPGHQE